MDERQRRCLGITKQGKACGFPPAPGHAYCLNHDPERKEELTESRRRGGYNRKATTRSRALLTAGVRTMADVHEELMLAFVKVRDEELDPKVALALASLARSMKDVAISADYEAQIAELREELSRVVMGELDDADDVQTA